MSRLFVAYCLMLVLSLGYANYKGYVYANFSSSSNSSGSGSTPGGHVSGGHYHK